ncbi:transglycosylase family protein [Gleimia hominis]|uniref:Transglycosylase family protein n=1 Tax=Gleimia hominis TaxID=595468 RepID=A0ABU3IA43_9ACTO|nr:transglycosylase family protein [Gleimia hominis]MDT3767244.1 transglycosylase family protein [Gleimia hominis]
MTHSNQTEPRWATYCSKKTVTAAAGLAAAALVATSAVGVAASHHTVTVEAEGITRPVDVWGGTVATALDSAGVDVSTHDQVTPNVNARLQNGQNIKVERAKSYRVKEGSTSRAVWSAASSMDQVLAGAQRGRDNTTVAADRSSVRSALPAVVSEPKSIRVVADGKTHSVAASTEDTVPSVLEKSGLKVSPIDQVHVSSDEKGMLIDVTRVSRGVKEEVKDIDFKTVERDTDELYKGEERVVSEGKKGQIKTTTYEQKRGDDVLVSTQVKQTRTEPEDRVIERGTKERPEETETAEASDNASASPQPGAGTGSAPDGVWGALAQCESGGDPSTNTGNGFYGLYQFTASTWQSVGGSGLPSDASAEEQTMRAKILQQRAGWGQWPACTSQLGLR